MDWTKVDWRKVAGALGAGLALTSISCFGLYLVRHEVQQNVVTWIMWAVLDLCIFASCYAARGSWKLAAGYTLGATFVSLVLLGKGTWHWSYTETICALGAAAAMLIWWQAGPRGAVVASTTAMTFAGLPVLKQTILEPNSASWWLWTGVAISCLLTIFSKEKWTIQDRFFPVGSFLFNATMAVLVWR